MWVGGSVGRGWSGPQTTPPSPSRGPEAIPCSQAREHTNKVGAAPEFGSGLSSRITPPLWVGGRGGLVTRGHVLRLASAVGCEPVDMPMVSDSHSHSHSDGKRKTCRRRRLGSGFQPFLEFCLLMCLGGKRLVLGMG